MLDKIDKVLSAVDFQQIKKTDFGDKVREYDELADVFYRLTLVNLILGNSTADTRRNITMLLEDRDTFTYKKEKDRYMRSLEKMYKTTLRLDTHMGRWAKDNQEKVCADIYTLTVKHLAETYFAMYSEVKTIYVQARALQGNFLSVVEFALGDEFDAVVQSLHNEREEWKRQQVEFSHSNDSKISKQRDDLLSRLDSLLSKKVGR